MITWFLIYTIVVIGNQGPTGETHYQTYSSQKECAIAKNAFNATDYVFAECFSKKIEQPTTTPKTSL